jgi:hypothetical protein
MVWTKKGTKRIRSSQITTLNSLRFKRRADLLNFHHRHPGGLAALFLWQVKQRMGGDPPKDSKQLKKVDTSTWVTMSSGLKEIRDQREVAFLAKILTELGHDRLDIAADLLAQRMREVLAAKKDGGSWEKAAVLSLLPSSHGGQALIPDGAFVA